MVYPGNDGFKTGWTEAAKYCFVSTCQRDGFRLIAVMGVPVPRGHFGRQKYYLIMVFSVFLSEFYTEDKVIGEVKVGKGK